MTEENDTNEKFAFWKCKEVRLTIFPLCCLRVCLCAETILYTMYGLQNIDSMTFEYQLNAFCYTENSLSESRFIMGRKTTSTWSIVARYHVWIYPLLVKLESCATWDREQAAYKIFLFMLCFTNLSNALAD